LLRLHLPLDGKV